MSTTSQRPRTAADIADVRRHEQAIEDDRTLPPPLVDALVGVRTAGTSV